MVCILVCNCLVSILGWIIVMFVLVLIIMGFGIFLMWLVLVKFFFLWVNVFVISIICGVKLFGWLVGFILLRLVWISLKEVGSYVVVCFLGYFGGNFDIYV